MKIHTRQPNHIFTALRRLLVVVALYFGLTMGAHGMETLIVVSSESAPYIQAAQACEQLLTKEGVSTRRVFLSDLTLVDMQRELNPIIAIGGRASLTLSNNLPAETQLYYCMTPSPDKIGLTDRPNTSGISTEIDLGEQIALIKLTKIDIKRIGLLYRSHSKHSVEQISAVKLAIPAGWQIVAIDLDRSKSASDGIKQLFDEDIDLIWTLPDTTVYNSATIRALLLESIRKKTPVLGFSHALVKAGASFGVGIAPDTQGESVAQLMIKSANNVHENAEPIFALNRIASDRIRMDLPEPFISRCDVVFRSD